MPCHDPRWKEMLVDHLADELDEENAILLEQHLAECPACTEDQRRLRELCDAAAPRLEWRPGQHLEAGLIRRLRAVSGRQSGNTPWVRQSAALLGKLARRPLPAYAAVPLVLLALAGGLWLGNSGSPSLPPQSAPLPAGSAATGRETNWVPAREDDSWFTLEAEFAVTPSDAVALVWGIEPDSL